MSTKKIKRCVVKCCSNTSINSPNKIFISFPKLPHLKRRERWLKALRLAILSTECCNMVCEDHFNLSEDAANWIHYKIMGNRIFLKPNVVPHLHLKTPSPHKFKSQLSRADRELRKERLLSLKEIRSAEIEKSNLDQVKTEKLTPDKTIGVMVNEDTSLHLNKEIKEECLEIEEQFIFVKQEDLQMDGSAPLEKFPMLASEQRQEKNILSRCEFTPAENTLMVNDEDVRPYTTKKIKEEFLETEPQYVFVKQEDLESTPEESILMANEDVGSFIKKKIKKECLETEKQYVFVKQENLEEEDSEPLEIVPSLTNQQQQEKNMSSCFEGQTLSQNVHLTQPCSNKIAKCVPAFRAQPPASTYERPSVEFQFLEEKSQGLEYELIEHNGRLYLSLPKDACLLKINRPIPILKK